MEAKINNWSGWVTECRPDILMAEYRERLKNSGFNIRRQCHEFFYPQGFTALFLLAESHFAIHTFPECGKTYLELSSCVEKPFDAFVKGMTGKTIEE